MKDAPVLIKSDHNTREHVPFSYRIVSGFFNVPYHLLSDKGYETGPPVYSPGVRFSNVPYKHLYLQQEHVSSFQTWQLFCLSLNLKHIRRAAFRGKGIIFSGPISYRVFRRSPYPRRLESLTICRCHYKGSTFDSPQLF